QKRTHYYSRWWRPAFANCMLAVPRRKTMKISLFYLPTYRSQRTTFQQLYRDILEEVEFADRNGFDAVWFAEHHFFPYGGTIPSVPVLAAAAAERTHRIRLGSGVGLIGLNDPI